MTSDFDSVKDVVNSEIVKEVYEDGLKPTVKNVGGILGAITGLINNVVLFPLKKWNISFEQKLIQFKKDVEEKYNKIPEEKRCEPNLSVVGPALEALKYNLDDDEIRVMFENLISNNMNSDLKNQTHPRFVEIIKSLSHIDAIVFKTIINNKINRIFRPKIEINGESANIKLPNYCFEIVDGVDIFSVSASLSNLANLGLIELDFLRFYKKEKYYSDLAEKNDELKYLYNIVIKGIEKVKKFPEDEQKKFKFYPLPNLSDIKINTKDHGIVTVTDFGKMFAKVCLE